MQFTSGELVKHKTGSRTMTVLKYLKKQIMVKKGIKSPFNTEKIEFLEEQTSKVLCEWVDDNNTKQQEEFEETTLEKI